MSMGVEDLEMLRLIKAFQKIRNQGTRRALVLLIEETAQKEASLPEPPKNSVEQLSHVALLHHGSRQRSLASGTSRSAVH